MPRLRRGLRRYVRVPLLGGLALLIASACAAPRPTPTPDPASMPPDSPLFGRPATQIALTPPIARPAQPTGTPVPPTPEPTPTPLPGSVAPPSARVRLIESIVVRREPRPDAPQSPLGRAPARLVAGAREVNGDWVRIEAAGISGWVPRAAVEFLP
jgi:hypothetical protein